MSLCISETVIWQETAHGVSLYQTDTGDFRTLNATAAQIWALVSDGGDRESVTTRLALLFGAPNARVAAQVRTDVGRFLDELVRDGLLTESPAGPTADVPAAPPAGVRTATAAGPP